MMHYELKETLGLERSVGMMAKNLQVVSFDADWNELYMGTVRHNCFLGVSTQAKSANVSVEVRGKKADEEMECDVAITAAKWCPLDLGTILVIGTRLDVRFYDWCGSSEVGRFDFESHGVTSKESCVSGASVRGLTAFGSNNVAVGLHTGVILNFGIMESETGLSCRLLHSCRMHSEPIADLASRPLVAKESVEEGTELLVSGDDNGLINIWHCHHTQMRHWARRELFLGSAVTAIVVLPSDLDVVAITFGNGKMRLMRLSKALMAAEVDAHAASITGLDLAPTSDTLITGSEDGFVRLWTVTALKRGGRVQVQHLFSIPVHEALITGIKFLDPEAKAFAVAAYDRDELLVFRQ